MPVVPSYDNLRTNVEQVRSPSVVPVGDIVARQQQRLGVGLSQAGGQAAQVLGEEIDKANQVRVVEAMNAAMAERLRLTHDKTDGFSVLQGKAALERPDGKSLDSEYADKFNETLRGIESGLGNDAQKRAFRMQAGQMAIQLRGQIQAHVANEDKQYRASTYDGTISVARSVMSQEALNPESVAQGQAAIKGATLEKGKLLGWSPEETTARMVDALSPAHQAVVATALQAGKVDYAREYMKRVQAELSPQARLELTKHLQEGEIAVVATQTADNLWAKHGLKDDRNAPVDLFAMEKAAREAFPNEPAKAKATIDELRQRATAWNASQREAHAAATTSVYRLLDQGVSFNKIRTSPEWNALPGDQQHRIKLSLEQEAAARESRAAAAESRAFTRMQRDDMLLQINNADAYMRYSDPASLASMSRLEVEALRPVLGRDATMHLLAKHDSLQKPGKLAEAKMDQQDFNHIADQMGMKPYDPKKSENEKKAIGELQYRVEQLIDRAQTVKKAPLTRDEKTELMRQELARTVTVGGWFSDTQVPVIALDPKQLAKVVVPASERAKIIEALRLRSEQEPGNTAFAPTEDNVRRLYVMKQSPAGGLLNAK